VAEGARLESVFRGNSNVGSNPTLSASKILMDLQSEPHRLPGSATVKNSKPSDIFSIGSVGEKEPCRKSNSTHARTVPGNTRRFPPRHRSRAATSHQKHPVLTHQKLWPQAPRAWTNITRSKGTRQSTGEDKARNAKNSAKFVSEDRCPDRWWTG
jgi:hypothetical protein